MKTYPEMNEKIVGILRQSDDPVVGYAAARIEELERQLETECPAAMACSEEAPAWPHFPPCNCPGCKLVRGIRQARREAEQRLVVDIEQNIDVVEGNLTGVKIDFL